MIFMAYVLSDEVMSVRLYGRGGVFRTLSVINDGTFFVKIVDSLYSQGL